ncbi:hypothetical protein GCM10009678_02740 [Actinomadura kijaniata]|uniref:Uncharacterized protein n=1 Tax=Actinomadura namibiensis TaxID=182080 RepID=A0A7W3LTU1_ACTNM|nr:hypothetical protein [Actinomadura namibiensis]MBA8954155.1 hypothetical protein [Actinomadura namibiensis]
MSDPAFVLRPDARVSPQPVAATLVRLVAEIQRVSWPLWIEPAVRARREVAGLCRLQTARGLTVLSWMALGPDADVPEDVRWLLTTSRLTGARQERMYAAADLLPAPVRALAVANWTWALGSPHGGQTTAAFLAGGAYPEDGYSAAHATVALLRLWERRPETRPPLAAAWAAIRTTADWCKAAELRSAYGAPVPIFSYPRVAPPPGVPVRPWITRLLGPVDGCDTG